MLDYDLADIYGYEVKRLNEQVKKTEKDIEKIQKSIDTLNESFVSDKEFRNFVIYKGQKFEADAAYIDIYQQATTSIYVVDDYVNTKTLQLLSQKKAGVEVILFTENGHGRKGFLTTAVVNDFASQYPPLHIKPNPDCHDRWSVKNLYSFLKKYPKSCEPMGYFPFFLTIFHFLKKLSLPVYASFHPGK